MNISGRCRATCEFRRPDHVSAVSEHPESKIPIRARGRSDSSPRHLHRSQRLYATPRGVVHARLSFDGHMTSHEDSTSAPEDEFWNSLLVAHLREPKLWTYHAEALRRAAEVVWEAYRAARFRNLDEIDAEALAESNRWVDNRLDLPFQMLAGLAIEALAKALYLKKHSPGSWSVDSLKKKLKSHSSLNLLDQCGILLVDSDRDLIGRLTDFVEWRGRYPAPFDAQRFTQALPDGSRVVAYGSHGGVDSAAWRDLYDRIRTALNDP